MKNKRLNGFAWFVFTVVTIQLNAQEAMVSAGGNATGSGGTSSYSVGQVSYATVSGSNGSVAQGVQQSFDISVVNAVEQTNGINLSCSTYPNPVEDKLKLKIEGDIQENSIANLYNSDGQIISTFKIVKNETIIPMETMVQGTYFLSISKNFQKINTFKIIKK